MIGRAAARVVSPAAVAHANVTRHRPSYLGWCRGGDCPILGFRGNAVTVCGQSRGLNLRVRAERPLDLLGRKPLFTAADWLPVGRGARGRREGPSVERGLTRRLSLQGERHPRPGPRSSSPASPRAPVGLCRPRGHGAAEVGAAGRERPRRLHRQPVGVRGARRAHSWSRPRPSWGGAGPWNVAGTGKARSQRTLGTSPNKGATFVQRWSSQPSLRVNVVSTAAPFQVPLTVAISGPP